MSDRETPVPAARAEGRAAATGLVILAGVLICLYLPVISDQIGSLGGDDARYVLLADALRTGQGYVNAERPGQPPHTLYPPVLPLLLVPLRAGAPDRLGAAHALIVVATLAALGALFVLLRGVAGTWPALFGVALFGLLPVTARALLPVLTEMPFIAFSLWALVAWEAHRRRGAGVDGPLLAAALLAAAAFLTRTAGVVTAGVVLAAVVARAWTLRTEHRVGRRAWIAVYTSLAIVVPALVGWMVWTRMHGGHGLGYVSQFLARDPYVPALGPVGMSGLLDRLAERATGYAREIPALFFEGFDPRGAWLVAGGVALGGIMLVGVARAVRARALWSLHLALYLGMILVWPWYGERFLLPAIPLLIALLVLGLEEVRERLARRAPRPLAAAVAAAPALVLLAACVPGWVRFHGALGADLVHRPRLAGLPAVDLSHTQEAQLWARQGPRTQHLAAAAWGDYLTAGRWVARRAPGAVLACRKPRLTALTAGTRTVGLPGPAKPEVWLERLAKNEVRFVLSLRGAFAPDAAQRALDALRKRYPDRVRVCTGAAFAHVVVLEILAPTPAPPHVEA